MIELNNLCKIYTARNNIPFTALDKLTARFSDGAITAVLGLNGAGKSTLMRIIYGLIPPTDGEVIVGGLNVATHPDLARRAMGCLADDTGLYTRLTARENIEYFGQLHGIPASLLTSCSDELINTLGMQSIAQRRCEGFSLGERMKTALARAIVHAPQHILLDEPTNGLDVLTTRSVRRLLLHLRNEGRCIIFSSHLMHEVDHLCDHLIILHHGKIIADGTIAQIKELTGKSNLEDAYVNLLEQQEVAP